MPACVPGARVPSKSVGHAHQPDPRRHRRAIPIQLLGDDEAGCSGRYDEDHAARVPRLLHAGDMRPRPFGDMRRDAAVQEGLRSPVLPAPVG